MKVEPSFVGAGTSRTRVAPAGATGPPAFSDADGTWPGSAPSAALKPPAVPPSGNEPPGLVEWLTSPAARLFEGKWVLLTNEFGVIDSDDSPSALLARHPEVSSPLVVFVQPGDVTLAVWR